MNFKNKEFYIDYEVEIDKGYGCEGVSDTLYLRFDEDGDLRDAVLMYMHDRREIECEAEYNIDTKQAMLIVLQDEIDSNNRKLYGKKKLGT